MNTIIPIKNNDELEQDLERAQAALTSICSMLLITVNELEPNTEAYRALEGVAIFADLAAKAANPQGGIQ
ncbi:hypothetical protein ACGRL8_08335 [Vibrio rumoiensis]|uniref:hypothetical protein n=1 Tax=Vibrio rumoiensis TaxID=76258 RepID=UPI003747F8FB